MTLSPVFRSPQAVRLLEEHQIWKRLGPALAAQAEAVQVIYDDLNEVIGERWRGPLPKNDSHEGGGDPELNFLQEYFFLTLFHSLFESLGVAPARLPLYAELNFCIKGTITAADNLFDDQAKSLLPLRTPGGARFASILQLMCFERLLRRAGERAEDAGAIPPGRFAAVQRALMDQMATIGELEGSEEGGVSEIPEPAAMIERVHRVRGGMLFGLAFAAPGQIEQGDVLARMREAEPAIARLGTAFQIVDDLTDFEFDLTRRSHNLLVAEIHHHGTPEARALLEGLWRGAPAGPGLVEGAFADAARAVLEAAYRETRAALTTLEGLGFWFPASLSEAVVHAIVGLDGVGRMNALTGQ